MGWEDFGPFSPYMYNSLPYCLQCNTYITCTVVLCMMCTTLYKSGFCYVQLQYSENVMFCVLKLSYLSTFIQRKIRPCNSKVQNFVVKEALTLLVPSPSKSWPQCSFDLIKRLSSIGPVVFLNYRRHKCGALMLWQKNLKLNCTTAL